MPGSHAPANIRFFRHVRYADGCWEWTGSTDKVSGYGQFAPSGGRSAKAHSWAYRYFIGDVPAGMQLDHLCHTRDAACPGGAACRHRRCANPWHLEPVLPVENTRRGRGNVSKTRCPQGHPYDEANTKRVSGRRLCRACQEAIRVAFAADPADAKHGTLSGYTYGCRRDCCTSVQRAYDAARRSAKAAA